MVNGYVSNKVLSRHRDRGSSVLFYILLPIVRYFNTNSENERRCYFRGLRGRNHNSRTAIRKNRQEE